MFKEIAIAEWGAVEHQSSSHHDPTSLSAERPPGVSLSPQGHHRGSL